MEHAERGGHRSDPIDASDESLMERYAHGDPVAFDTLFHRHERRAHGYFRKRTGSVERARDLHQELFLRVHRGRDRYDPRRPFLPWFFQIASRLLMDDARRAFRSHEAGLVGREPSATNAGRDRLAERELLEHALQALSADERFVLISARVEGVGYPELARRLGKSADAVKKMASRAAQRVRRSELHEGSFQAVGPLGRPARQGEA